MGKETKEDVVDFMEEALGLDENALTKKEIENVIEEVVPTSEIQAPTTTLVTQEQITLNKEIAKLDVQIEALSGSTVDAEEFYDNLETHLSEEEQALEFSDKSAYMKLVSKKAKEYEAAQSKQGEINNLLEQKKELELVYERQSAIVEVTAKYPHYDHEKVLNFFMKKLSADEQDEITQASKSYADVYEHTYKKYVAANPTNIHTQKTPNIPNVSNVRKQSVNNSTIDNGFTSHDAQLKQALGL